MISSTNQNTRLGDKAPLSRRIILLLDGTWNEDEIGGNSTNIVRLRELMADSLDALETVLAPGTSPSPGSRADLSPRTFKDREYVVFYERGVGTGPLDRVRGGGFGIGLDLNVRRAYRFLSFHYLPRDEIFVFGFSRGAYTARSLTGYLGAVGLLRCKTCTPEREALAWSFYRTPPNDRLPGIWKELEPHVHPRGMVRITCLGLFDTVGALGVPLQGFRRLNRQKFEYHDVELSSLIDVALHALAIDEHRRPFEASLWRRNKFKQTSAIVEQVWFPGVHADIGGGYLNDDERYSPGVARAFDDLALDWMIKRVWNHFPDFPLDKWPSLTEQEELRPRHESLTWKYKLWKKAIRSIGDRPIWPALLSSRDILVGSDPYALAMNESVHIRAIQQIGTSGGVEHRTGPYLPLNLISALSALEWLYSNDGPPTIAADTLTVTGADGEVVLPQSADAPSVYAALMAARERLQRVAPGLFSKMNIGARV